MTDQSTSPDGGAMTVDQAIESLIPQPEPEQPAAPAEAAAETVEEPEAPSEADPTAEDPSEPDEVNAEGEEEAEKEEPAQPAIDPPPFWDADAKAAFASLTPEQQTIVSAQANKQATEASKAIQTAAERAKAAETQAARVSDLAAGLNEFLPKAVETFKDRWNVDWAEWARLDPTEAFKGKIQFEAEQQELQQLSAAKEQADQLAAENFVKEEFAKLPEVAPDLVDPKEGAARRKALAGYLIEQGVVTHDQLPNVSAKEMSIAYKAMLYDKLKAAPPKVAPKIPTPAAKPPARPGAAAATPNRSATAANRYAQTRSVDDAVALLMSKGQ